MNILLTNDDGYLAPGIAALFHAVADLGQVFVVAPSEECSACSHTVTMRRTVRVRRLEMDHCGPLYAVDGTPADCVRLAVSELIREPIDLVLSGVNNGANSGVDVFYSGTVAGAREAAILNLPAIAVSQSLRSGVATDWTNVTRIVRHVIRDLLSRTLPGPGFWSVNLPAPIPHDAEDRIQHVPIEAIPAPMQYSRVAGNHDDEVREFTNGGCYWTREAKERTDFTVIRDGGVAVSAIPLYGRF